MSERITIEARASLIHIAIRDVISRDTLAYISLPEVPADSDRIKLRTEGVEHEETWVVTCRTWAIETRPPGELRTVTLWVRKEI
jgi:hypothetical protein